MLNPEINVTSGEAKMSSKTIALAAMAMVAILGMGTKLGSDTLANHCRMADMDVGAFQAPGLPEGLCANNESFRDSITEIAMPTTVARPFSS